MKPLSIAIFLLFTGLGIYARGPQLTMPANPHAAAFDAAYKKHPQVPRGLLEAVAFTNTRFQHIEPGETESCTGMPRALTVMGLMDEGENWFRENLKTVSQLSGYPKEALLADPAKAIEAYAAAYAGLASAYGLVIDEDSVIYDEQFIPPILEKLSELPLPKKNEPAAFLQSRYVLDSWLYSVFVFLNDEKCAAAYGFPQWNIQLQNMFGENLRILSSASVRMSEDAVISREGLHYSAVIGRFDRCGGGQKIIISDSNSVQSPDYGPALWNPAASCNYSSRNSVAVSAVTIHTVQGGYAGCISWFQNCNAGVSAHYVVRSSDGQITQMVYESLKAWHVGTENPYTVGIEHEGFVNNPAWYTVAMYTSSAALVGDICTSHGIDPLRTGWWPWLPTTYYNQSSIPGSCTRVKGHMHYPSQSHTDPGVNWDWDYFYTLINTPPPAGMLTAATGNFYDLGGPGGDYYDDERSIWTIAPTGATSLTLTFNSFSLESTWDYLYIYDGADINAPLIGYYTGANNPGTITASGGALTVEFRSDCATTGSGWDAYWNSTISNPPNPDVTAPATQVSVSGTWQTADFTASFAESDDMGGSGLEKSFYQVIDFDGSDWRANHTQGFFSDNFDLPGIHAEWTSAAGTWGINNSVLEQSDESQGNANIYAPLTQNLSNKYLYNWAGKIDGTGSNRRAGFHFFCDNPALPNRGNNYFVWFRVDQSALEFYEVANDAFTLMHSEAMTVNPGQWYDWKVVYDRITGEINVYQDNALIGSWTDPTPYASGDYVSFRSGNCNWQINNFKVYRSRFSNQPLTVSVGACPSCEIRYQNTNPGTPSGRVKSLVRDSAHNISAVAYQDVNVDWTAPSPVDTINDGPASDLDLGISPSALESNWSASSDPHSGLARYWYAIGTAPCDSDVVAWTDNWGYDTALATGLNLQNGMTYYFSVIAENGAGLYTPCYSSDGIYIDLTTDLNDQSLIAALAAMPNPFEAETQVVFALKEHADVQFTLSDALGKTVFVKQLEKPAGTHTLAIDPVSLGLSPGVYFLNVQANGHSRVLKLIKR